MEIIDVHAHILFEGLQGMCGDAGPEMGVDASGRQFFRAGTSVVTDVAFLDSPFSRVDLRLARMTELDIDQQVVSPNPSTFFYGEPPDVAVRFNRAANDLMAEAAMQDRLHGCATLPMQDPDAACAELRRAVEDLGLVASYIGSDVAGVPLSDPRYEDLWAEHERLNLPVVVHPSRRSPARKDHFLTQWDLAIVLGHLLDEGLAAAHLLYSGVLDRHPRLRVHIAHGGGFAPYQKGRLEAALVKRPWGPDLLERDFASQWRQLTFDSAVHSPEALAYLVATEGADRVLFGSNFSGWDQDARPRDLVDAGVPDETERRQVFASNARAFFGLP